MRACLAAALRDGRLPAQAAGFAAATLLAAAGGEGVAALLESRLREGGAWDDVPAPLRDGLAEAARAAAAQWMLRERELRRIEAALADAGLEALLLKGSALALWLYPRPYLRMGGDIDLLLASRGDADRAAQALSALGYALAFAPGSTHFEMTCRLVVDGVLRSELDLHFRLLNSAAYADIFGFRELRDASLALPGMGGALRALSPAHALAHAGLNRALDMQNGIPDRLKLLYDIRLAAARNGAAEWRELCELATAKNIAGACLRSLEDAARMLDAPLPADVRIRLQAQADAEPLDYRRIGDWRYMQVRNFRALPSVSSRLHWLWERTFPPRAQLHELYGDGSWVLLMLRRMRSGWSRLR